MLMIKSVTLILAAAVMSFFVIHAILARLWRSRSGQVVALATVVMAFVPTLVIAIVCIRPATGTLFVWVYLFLAYTALGYTYFHFFNTSETARRIRLIHEIDLAGGLTKERILALYRTEDILQLRLQRLVHLGQLRLINGSYSISNKTLYVAALITEGWQYLLGFKKRG